jgi:hypothetical protein
MAGLKQKRVNLHLNTVSEMKREWT